MVKLYHLVYQFYVREPDYVLIKTQKDLNGYLFVQIISSLLQFLTYFLLMLFNVAKQTVRIIQLVIKIRK